MTSAELSKPEYIAASAIRERCFQQDQSYLFPAERIWTPENIDLLLTSKGATPSEAGGTTFIEKLRAQLNPLPLECSKLAADVLCLYYLFPSKDVVSNNRKRSLVTTVLESRGISPPPLLDSTFSDGIGGTGTHYLAAQNDIFNSILNIALRGKQMGVNFEDPRSIEGLFAEIRETEQLPVELPHAVLHLFYPARYEPIISDRHKRAIVSHFGPDLAELDNLDDSLRTLRTRLEPELGSDFSYYAPPIRSRWDSGPSAGNGERVPSTERPDRLPTYEELMLPYLTLIGDGSVHREAELAGALADHFKLSEEDLKRTSPSGPTVFPNRVRLAKVNLRQAGLVDIPANGSVIITTAGRELLSENPPELTRALLKRYPEYVDFLNRSKDECRPGNIWIEKTIVQDRSDRQHGEWSLGKALWSPEKSDDGRDIYRFMRDVRPGDIILHLTDNRGFTGISEAADVAQHFTGLPGTPWADRPSLFIRLKGFVPLDPPLLREAFFAPPYRERLAQLRRSGQRNLFFTEGFELVQGGYLTPCTPELAAILNDAYTDLAGKQLTEAPATETLHNAPEPAFSIEDLMRTTLWPESDLNELLDALSPGRPCKQIILAGPPGTGKTWVAQEIVKFLTEDNDARWRLVQFHPSYSYEQFVEGLRPEADGSGIAFRAAPGVLLEMAKRSASTPDSHFLIIDEINRANLPRVLGELFYLFEYRATSIDLPYTRQFALPENLFFIATMNTADRSIRSIDAALRRRFEIFECLPSVSILKRYYEEFTNQVPDLLPGFEKLNETLSGLLDKHHTVGHTFFMSPVFSPKDLRRVWVRQIGPLIEEYFFDEPDRIKIFALEEFWPSLAS